MSRDHVRLMVSNPPKLSASDLAQYVKGRSSHLLHREFAELRRRYWGQQLWARGYFCASAGTVTDEMIRAYLAQQGVPRAAGRTSRSRAYLAQQGVPPDDGFTMADDKL